MVSTEFHKILKNFHTLKVQNFYWQWISAVLSINTLMEDFLSTNRTISTFLSTNRTISTFLSTNRTISTFHQAKFFNRFTNTRFLFLSRYRVREPKICRKHKVFPYCKCSHDNIVLLIEQLEVSTCFEII